MVTLPQSPNDPTVDEIERLLSEYARLKKEIAEVKKAIIGTDLPVPDEAWDNWLAEQMQKAEEEAEREVPADQVIFVVRPTCADEELFKRFESLNSELNDLTDFCTEWSFYREVDLCLELVRLFPSLDDCADAIIASPFEFAEWVEHYDSATNAFHAARFVAENCFQDARLTPRFDLLEAFRVWDDDHKKAYLTAKRGPFGIIPYLYGLRNDS